jgi:hypothetical protein
MDRGGEAESRKGQGWGEGGGQSPPYYLSYYSIQMTQNTDGQIEEIVKVTSTDSLVTCADSEVSATDSQVTSADQDNVYGLELQVTKG